MYSSHGNNRSSVAASAQRQRTARGIRADDALLFLVTLSRTAQPTIMSFRKVKAVNSDSEE